jgi:hypothetical protein
MQEMTRKGWQSLSPGLRMVLALLAIQQGVTPDANDIASPFFFHLVASDPSHSNPALGVVTGGHTNNSRKESPLPDRGNSPFEDEDEDANSDESCTLTLSIERITTRLQVRTSPPPRSVSDRWPYQLANPASFESQSALGSSTRGGLIHLLCRLTC